MSNDLISVLLGERLKLFIALNGLPDSRDLLTRNVTGQVLAMFASLELIKRPGSTIFDDRQFAPLHGLDLGDLLENRR